MKNRIKKSLALFSFISLLTCFIAFKTGTFNNIIQTSDTHILNYELLSKSIALDTPTVKNIDTVKENPTMFSTSKSVILFDQRIKFPIKELQGTDSSISTTKK